MARCPKGGGACHHPPRGFPVSGCKKVWGVGEGDRTGAGGGSSPRSSMEWLWVRRGGAWFSEPAPSTDRKREERRPCTRARSESTCCWYSSARLGLLGISSLVGS